MKKGFVLVLVFALLATGAFAQFTMSAGGGLRFNPSFNNGFEGKMSIPLISYAMDVSSHWTDIGIGAFAFLDATYAEFNIYLGYNRMTGGGGGGARADQANINNSVSVSGSGNGMDLGFTLLGKYPFHPSKKISLFPLLGVEYNLALSRGANVKDTVKNYSQLGFLGGLGLDFGFNDRVFLRAEAMFQLRLPPKVVNDQEDVFKELDSLSGYYGGSGMNSSFDSSLGMGPVIKVGVGYKFYGVKKTPARRAPARAPARPPARR